MKNKLDKEKFNRPKLQQYPWQWQVHMFSLYPRIWGKIILLWNFLPNTFPLPIVYFPLIPLSTLCWKWGQTVLPLKDKTSFAETSVAPIAVPRIRILNVRKWHGPVNQPQSGPVLFHWKVSKSQCVTIMCIKSEAFSNVLFDNVHKGASVTRLCQSFVCKSRCVPETWQVYSPLFGWYEARYVSPLIL